MGPPLAFSGWGWRAEGCVKIRLGRSYLHARTRWRGQPSFLRWATLHMPLALRLLYQGPTSGLARASQLLASPLLS